MEKIHFKNKPTVYACLHEAILRVSVGYFKINISSYEADMQLGQVAVLHAACIKPQWQFSKQSTVFVKFESYNV